MANSLGTLSAGVIARDTLRSVVKQFPMLRSIAKDFSGEQASFGETVTSRVVTNPTVSDYHTTNGYVAGDATTVDVPVTINAHKHVSLAFGEQEISGSGRNLMAEQQDAAAYALGRALVTSVYGLMVPANFPAATNETVIVTANADRDAYKGARKALRSRGAAGPLFGILNGDLFDVLTNDAKVTSKDYINEFPDFDGGMLANVGGVRTTYEDFDLPSANNLTGFVGTSDSLVIASRVPKDPALYLAEAGVDLDMPGTIEIFTDEATGLSIMSRYHYDMQLGKLQMTLTWMYGIAKGVANSGELIVSATNV